MRNSSPRDISNFPRIWFRDLKFRTWGLKINYLNAHNFVWQGCFFFHYYLATSTTDWYQIFTGLLFYACWDTPTVKASFWQLPIVSTVFNISSSNQNYSKLYPVSFLKVIGLFFNFFIIFFYRKQVSGPRRMTEFSPELRRIKSLQQKKKMHWINQGK